MEYKKQYRKFLTAHILDLITNKIIGSSILVVSFALFLGLPDKAIGFLSIISSVACLFQLFSAPLFSKIGQSKKRFFLLYLCCRFFSVFPIFIYFISEDILIRTILFIGSILISQFFGQICYSPIVSWRMGIIKKEEWNKYHSQKSFFQNIFSTSFSLGLGILIDHLKIIDQELSGYLILFFIAIILITLDVFIRNQIPKPVMREEKTTLQDFVIPLKDKKFQEILIISGLFNFALVFGLQYLSLFELKYLKLPLTYATLLNVIIALSSAFIGLIWGRKSKLQWKKLLLFITALNVVYFLIYAFISKSCIFLLPLGAFLFGASDSGIQLFETNAACESLNKNYQTLYLSMCKVIKGIAALLVPIISFFLLSKTENEWIIRVVFFTSSMLFAFTFFYIYFKYKNDSFNIKKI